MILSLIQQQCSKVILILISVQVQIHKLSQRPCLPLLKGAFKKLKKEIWKQLTHLGTSAPHPPSLKSGSALTWFNVICYFDVIVIMWFFPQLDWSGTSASSGVTHLCDTWNSHLPSAIFQHPDKCINFQLTRTLAINPSMPNHTKDISLLINSTWSALTCQW